MNRVVKYFRRLLGYQTEIVPIKDEEKIERYVLTGCQFGNVVSMIYMGECVGFEDLLVRWEHAEREYAALGFRTIPIDAFVDAGGWGKELVGLRTPRDIGEAPIFHAAYYRQYCLGQLQPAINFNEILKSGKYQAGTYEVPTTQHLKRK